MMAGLDLGKAKSILGSTFVDNHNTINEDDAAHLVVKANQVIKDLQEEMDQHEELQAAMQIVKDLKSGYTNAIKYEQAKIYYLLEKIKEIQEGDVNPTASI
jgi:hypothetical protein